MATSHSTKRPRSPSNENSSWETAFNWLRLPSKNAIATEYLLFPKIYEINNETKIDILLREECGSIICGSPMVLFSHRAQFSPQYPAIHQLCCVDDLLPSCVPAATQPPNGRRCNSIMQREINSYTQPRGGLRCWSPSYHLRTKRWTQTSRRAHRWMHGHAAPKISKFAKSKSSLLP